MSSPAKIRGSGQNGIGGRMGAEAVLAREPLPWLLGSVCDSFRQPFGAGLPTQELPPSRTAAIFHEAARSLGFERGARDEFAHGGDALSWLGLAHAACGAAIGRGSLDCLSLSAGDDNCLKGFNFPQEEISKLG